MFYSFFTSHALYKKVIWRNKKNENLLLNFEKRVIENNAFYCDNDNFTTYKNNNLPVANANLLMHEVDTT